MLSITSDFVSSTGDPSPYLRLIAEAGFTHIHWCHQWNTDYVYLLKEIDQIAAWLDDFGLILNDLHSTEGIANYWVSSDESRRQNGVGLIKNRIQLAARLGGDVIIQHAQMDPLGDGNIRLFWPQLQKSLADLEPFARAYGVRIAFENLLNNFETLKMLFDNYAPDYIGLCLDTGHANMIPGHLDRLSAFKDRLISIHLHDNDGQSDQHKLPFTGSLDWESVVRFIAESPYQKCINLEVGIHQSGIPDEALFLQGAYQRGMELSRLISGYKETIKGD